MPRPSRSLAVLLTGVVLAGCGIPRDPHGRLDRVRGDTRQAGVSEASLFFVPMTEVDLVERLERAARDLAGVDRRVHDSVVGPVASLEPQAFLDEEQDR